MTARCFLPLMRGETSNHRSPDEWVGYELMGNPAVFQSDYKAVRLGVWTATPEAGSWKLYNLKMDPSEIHDLSNQDPKLLTQLIVRYDEYSNKVGIIDVPDDVNPVKALNQARPK